MNSLVMAVIIFEWIIIIIISIYGRASWSKVKSIDWRRVMPHACSSWPNNTSGILLIETVQHKYRLGSPAFSSWKNLWKTWQRSYYCPQIHSFIHSFIRSREMSHPYVAWTTTSRRLIDSTEWSWVVSTEWSSFTYCCRLGVSLVNSFRTTTIDRIFQ